MTLGIRLKLHEQGYVPLPDRGKKPLIKGWNVIQPSIADIKSWPAGSTAIRCDGVLAIDADIDDERLAAAVEEAIVKLFGDALVVRRRQNSPRFAVLFRRDFKWKTKMLAYEGASVEFLGSGSKITCFGRHSSGVPYLWPAQSPLEVAYLDLPKITQDGLRQLLGALEAVFEAHGLKKRERHGGNGERGGKMEHKELLTWETMIDVWDEAQVDTTPMRLVDIKEDCFVTCSFVRPDSRGKHQLQFRQNGIPFIKDWSAWICWELKVDPEPLESKSAPAAEFEAVDFKELGETPIEAIPWLVGTFLAEGNITGVAATPNVGKTRLLISLALAVASGSDAYVGMPVHRRGPVAIITNEERRSDLRRRIKATWQHIGKTPQSKILIRGRDKGQLKLVSRNERGDAVVDQEKLNALCEELKGMKLILLDPFVSLSEGIDENSSDMKVVTQVLIDLAEATGAAVCFMHHTPKDRTKADNWYGGSLDAFRGSSAIGASFDMGYTLSRVRPDKEKTDAPRLPEADRKRWLRLEPAKIREGLLDDETILYLHSHTLHQEQYDVGVVQPTSMEALLHAEGDYAEEALSKSVELGEARKLLAKTLRVPGTYSLRQVLTKMSKVEGWKHPAINKRAYDYLRYLMKKPFECDGYLYTLRSHPKECVTVECL